MEKLAQYFVLSQCASTSPARIIQHDHINNMSNLVRMKTGFMVMIPATTCMINGTQTIWIRMSVGVDVSLENAKCVITTIITSIMYNVNRTLRLWYPFRWQTPNKRSVKPDVTTPIIASSMDMLSIHPQYIETQLRQSSKSTRKSHITGDKWISSWQRGFRKLSISQNL